MGEASICYIGKLDQKSIKEIWRNLNPDLLYAIALPNPGEVKFLGRNLERVFEMLGYEGRGAIYGPVGGCENWENQGLNEIVKLGE